MGTARGQGQGKCRTCKRSRQIRVHWAKTEYGRSAINKQTPRAEHGQATGDGTHTDCKCTRRMPSTQARPTNGPHAREQKTGDGDVGPEGRGTHNTRRLRAWRANAYYANMADERSAHTLSGQPADSVHANQRARKHGRRTHAGGRAHAGDDDMHGNDEHAGRMPSTQTQPTNGPRVRDGRTGEGTRRTGH
ncbi:uncharacterized protein C8Q71DRAFT_738937 [Rhodofomes roseus]|uniref:Uncharacterized protein n=1 Tax=Rhodofomes roseus TaxID=34475 RepID=A0ABQ8KSM2_9APHY|nr:uncharacterized protein C8Q71DRAFT_738937 [Rhodofomes roseus]KAH9841820.1 hypothetical protein C8Q71DRAFT_738937 [Rhodofomes roseus]